MVCFVKVFDGRFLEKWGESKCFRFKDILGWGSC